MNTPKTTTLAESVVNSYTSNGPISSARDPLADEPISITEEELKIRVQGGLPISSMASRSLRSECFSPGPHRHRCCDPEQGSEPGSEENRARGFRPRLLWHPRARVSGMQLANCRGSFCFRPCAGQGREQPSQLRAQFISCQRRLSVVL